MSTLTCVSLLSPFLPTNLTVTPPFLIAFKRATVENMHFYLFPLCSTSLNTVNQRVECFEGTCFLYQNKRCHTNRSECLGLSQHTTFTTLSNASLLLRRDGSFGDETSEGRRLRGKKNAGTKSHLSACACHYRSGPYVR